MIEHETQLEADSALLPGMGPRERDPLMDLPGAPPDSALRGLIRIVCTAPGSVSLCL